MTAMPVTTLMTHFAHLTDPRVARTREHTLNDIVAIAICATICGANNWVEVGAFGNAKPAWRQTFLDLPNGIPSPDTFGRVFAQLDPEEFETAFRTWVQALSTVSTGQVLAVDGKCLRGSHHRGVGQNAMYLVSAWASAKRLILGQRQVDVKSNEITAVPAL